MSKYCTQGQWADSEQEEKKPSGFGKYLNTEFKGQKTILLLFFFNVWSASEHTSLLSGNSPVAKIQ